jgi:hypothetical protein
VVGPYVGRYDPYTETIHTDIPDSDDESWKNLFNYKDRYQ